jgi:ribosomal protein S25
MLKRLDVAINTANKAIANLSALGIIREVTGRQRNRVYEYTRVMAIVSEGTEPLPR